MKIETLTQLTKAPGKGYLLAYTRKEVKLASYESIDDVKKWLMTSSDPLELHLFNKEKEYRAIRSESRRYCKPEEDYTFIECIVSDECYSGVEFSRYEEKTLLEDKRVLNLSGAGKENQEYLTVINYITFDEENQMAEIKDYRLKMGGR